MAFTNYDAKEINCKIVYFGSRGSGRTTNLRSLYKNTSSDDNSSILNLEYEDSSNRFFRFLPISLGYIRGFHVKAHLFILPDENAYETVPEVILKGIDGFVFVADSRIEKMVDNIFALQKAKKLLSDKGLRPLEMPTVYQYNKRDLDQVVPISLLKRELNTTNGIDIEAIASQDVGTLETLQAMAKQIIQKISP